MVDAFQELGEHLCNTSLCLKKVVDKGSSLKVRLVDLPLCYNLTLQGSFPRLLREYLYIVTYRCNITDWCLLSRNRHNEVEA